MTSFILRIFVTGLIAFVPSRDGRELTLLLVDAGAYETMSTGEAAPRHHPLLLARAGRCQGACRIDDTAIASLLYPAAPDGEAARNLRSAVGPSAAWRLADSDLGIALDASQISRAPLTLTPSFQRVVELGRFVPSAGAVNPELLACHPPQGLIAGRLRLRSGKVSTLRFARVQQQVVPFDFKTLAGGSAAVPFGQPIADWVMAEIEVQGDAVDIVEHRFTGSQVRTLHLSPDPGNGLVELALLNIPDPPRDHGHPDGDPAAAAVHFELFYKLAKTPPPIGQRPVPQAAAAPRSAIKDPAGPFSPLLAALMLDVPKGFYEKIICAVAQLSESPAP